MPYRRVHRGEDGLHHLDACRARGTVRVRVRVIARARARARVRVRASRMPAALGSGYG